MSTEASVAPYLSIIVTGRNDGYGGDFVARFFATLQFNHRELTARAVAYELLLVEWAPVAGAPLLADLVDDRCPADVAAACRAAESAARLPRVPGQERRRASRARGVRAHDQL
ncbi:MAG: hypothetical protein HYU37_22735 [Acidobacteria bacterium]|nr:hypothetical protein [Acidobacteriota bacterium]